MHSRFLGSIVAHENWIRSAQFSPDSRLIVSSADDGYVKLWDSETCTLIADFQNDPIVMSTCFHPDGTSLATGDACGKVNLWDVRSKMLL